MNLHERIKQSELDSLKVKEQIKDDIKEFITMITFNQNENNALFEKIHKVSPNSRNTVSFELVVMFLTGIRDICEGKSISFEEKILIDLEETDGAWRKIAPNLTYIFSIKNKIDAFLFKLKESQLIFNLEEEPNIQIPFLFDFLEKVLLDDETL